MSERDGAGSLLVGRLRRGLLDVLAETVGQGQRVALVGFPDHPNVGDNAIWLGELAALKELRTEVAITWSAWGYDADLVRRRLGGQGKLLLHGGGNLGDEWPVHQRMRQRVIAEFADLPIVQLPQSVHFNAAESLEDARTVFDAHPDLTLLCRDPRSAQVAEREFANARIRLCPDAAFGLSQLDGRRGDGAGVLWLTRTDEERRGGRLCADRPGHRTADWLSEHRGSLGWEGSYGVKLRVQAVLQRAMRGHRALAPATGALATVQRRAAWQRVRFGAGLLSSARVVVTDRLHAHVLCLLLGVPHVVVDTGYGKIESFVRAWSIDAHEVRLAQDPAEAATLAEELMAVSAT